jgi:transcriptional regulator with XRE-family HTH domain
LDKSLSFQIRSLRDRENWTQAQFAEKLGIKHQNNVSARLENPYYGKHTLTTLKKIAAACDVGLVVWFVPFSRLADWVSGTPHVDEGLSPNFYDVPAFDNDPGLTASPANVAKKEAESIPDAHDTIAPGNPQLRLVPSGTGISLATAV